MQLKRFYINIAGFVITLFMILSLFDYISTCDDWNLLFARYTDSVDYLFGNVGTKDINPYIEAVKEDDGTSRLIIGDSICRQLFDDFKDSDSDFSIAGTNQAITMAGQYIMAKEYLDIHPKATDIYLIVHPESLEKTFDTRVGYQYAVMPFVETDTISNLDPETIKKMESVYGRLFMREDVVRIIDKSGVNRKLYLNMLKSYSKDYVMSDRFELANLYICKIKEICDKKGVTLHLLPTPVSDVYKDSVDEMSDDFINSDIYGINPDYLHEIFYYPGEQAADSRHFSGEYANRDHYDQIIGIMYQGTGLTDLLPAEQ